VDYHLQGVRYRFDRFVISPARRVLLADGQPVRLIPRYFDLLVLLVDERHRAVTRDEIFDRVWADVVVSDGALSQAVRTIRRTLGDGPQTPQFIRTVSRHGYQFVCEHVVVEPDEGPIASPVLATLVKDAGVRLPAPAVGTDDPFDRLLAILLREGRHSSATEEERYDAAVALHELGTDEALERLDARAGHEEARAILRDARWNAAGAGHVPLLRVRGRLVAIADVVALRIRHASALASARWLSSIAGGAVAGAIAGVAGGVALDLVGGRLDAGLVLSLAVIGTLAGALGAAGIGGGLAAAEALARSARAVALTAGGAFGGLLVGALAHQMAHSVLARVFGRDMPQLAGGPEGLVLGGVLGLGYAVATRRLVEGGMAAPRGRARRRAALLTGVIAAVAGVVLTVAGRRLVATSLDLIAGSFAGSGVGLAPLAETLGEGSLRPITQMIASAFEALMLGIGVSYGLMRRPRA
jgi:DNA-binding winged helix-turn-helix (wHTH) protein